MKDKIKKILDYLNENAYERQEAIALSLLSALAGESIFLLGLPGVGKSMIARKLKKAFKDAKVFEYLMSRFSTPDEIFGPVSITGLKDNDRYERVTQGYLPEAEVIFLDEIWKAGPAIQNSLLTVLNEKIFLNGNREMALPVKAIIAASNELPAEDEGLEALWDRFLIRYVVRPIKSKKNFFRLFEKETSSEPNNSINPITNQEYMEITRAKDNVKIPEKILNLIYNIREKLNIHSEVADEEDPAKIYISDRRWKKAVGIMKTSALLNDRNEVNLTDVVLFSHMLWDDDSMIEEINNVLAENIIITIHEDLMASYRAKVEKNYSEGKTPFSMDGKNYIIQCDDNPLKISRTDYNKIKSKPGEYFFGSETRNGTLIILPDRGQCSVKFIREGVININSYNYHLKSLSETSERIYEGQELEVVSDRLIREFENSVKENVFIKDAEILKSIHVYGKVYKEKLKNL